MFRLRFSMRRQSLLRLNWEVEAPAETNFQHNRLQHNRLQHNRLQHNCWGVVGALPQEPKHLLKIGVVTPPEFSARVFALSSRQVNATAIQKVQSENA